MGAAIFFEFDFLYFTEFAASIVKVKAVCIKVAGT